MQGVRFLAAAWCTILPTNSEPVKKIRSQRCARRAAGGEERGQEHRVRVGVRAGPNGRPRLDTVPRQGFLTLTLTAIPRSLIQP